MPNGRTFVCYAPDLIPSIINEAPSLKKMVRRPQLGLDANHAVAPKARVTLAQDTQQRHSMILSSLVRWKFTPFAVEVRVTTAPRLSPYV